MQGRLWTPDAIVSAIVFPARMGVPQTVRGMRTGLDYSSTRSVKTSAGRSTARVSVADNHSRLGHNQRRQTECTDDRPHVGSERGKVQQIGERRHIRWHHE